jgi:hypothetical protein
MSTSTDRDEEAMRRPTGSLTPNPVNAAGVLLAFGYLGVLCLGPLPPLAVLLVTRRSPVLRVHAVQALNTALTWALYLVSAAIVGGLLALDSITVALVIMIPVTTFGWAWLAVTLFRAAAAAGRGEFRELPGWACAAFVR